MLANMLKTTEWSNQSGGLRCLDLGICFRHSRAIRQSLRGCTITSGSWRVRVSCTSGTSVSRIFRLVILRRAQCRGTRVDHDLWYVIWCSLPGFVIEDSASQVILMASDQVTILKFDQKQHWSGNFLNNCRYPFLSSTKFCAYTVSPFVKTRSASRTVVRYLVLKLTLLNMFSTYSRL